MRPSTAPAALILAAGKGTRMKSSTPKVLHLVAGKPMLARVIENARAAGVTDFSVVIGHGRDAIRQHSAFEKEEALRWIVQEEQRGTGHAVQICEAAMKDVAGPILILSGDVPRLSAAMITAFLEAHRASDCAASVLCARVGDPTGYGRVLRDARSGRFQGIVEHKDASEAQRLVREINSGIYLVDKELLFGRVKNLAADNAQKELYLTDVFTGAARDGIPVNAVVLDPAEDLLGINDRVDLARAEKQTFLDNCRKLMRAGVTILDPDHTYVHDEVQVGEDSTIYPGAFLLGKTRVGPRCTILGHVAIRDSVVEEGSQILEFTRIDGSKVGPRCQVGPATHLRPGTELHEGVKVGNFVEIKKSVLGAGTKASHLSYLGDAVIGQRCNVGAGTITCNYDGRNKHRTTIGDDVFVGSDSVLVAPLVLGDRSYVAAASVITRDVPGGALGIGRARQVNKPGYRDLIEERFGPKEGSHGASKEEKS